MTRQWTRRDVLKASATSGMFVGVQAWGGLNSRASAAPVSGSPQAEDLRIERLAERIMETPPDRIVEFVMAELANGLSRQQLLAANFNAGARFRGGHQGYVAHPVRVVSDEIASEMSLLPHFYHLSGLKFRAPERRLHEVELTKLPKAENAEAHFHAAMKQGDRDEATLAILAMSRDIGPKQAYQHLWMYGAERNHNSAGHTAISTANTWRAMQATDWRCAETALRFAIVKASQPPKGTNLHAVNRERANRVGELSPKWLGLKSDRGAVLELLDLYRKGDPNIACQTTFNKLRDGEMQARSVWDAVFLTTAELIIRYTWVGSRMFAGHSITCVNALHYMFRLLTDPVARLYAMLEAVEWTTNFLDRERHLFQDRSIIDIEPIDPPKGNESLEAIFSLLPPRRFSSLSRVGFDDLERAMELTYGWAKGRTDFRPYLETAQRLMCLKSSPEVHDFKFPMALFENIRYASREWKPCLLAASVHVLQGSEMEDSKIVNQAREMLGRSSRSK